MGMCEEEHLAPGSHTQVAAVRADVATKLVDVMGHKEPICLLTAEVVSLLRHWL